MNKKTKQELENWRWAHSDGWLEDHLDISEQPTFKYYKSGRAFDESSDPPIVVDEQLAEKTEAIVVHIGTIDQDIYQAMVGYWPYGRSCARIARDMKKSVRYVKSCLAAGERMYQRIRKSGTWV